MKELLKCEFLKTRKRYILLTALAITTADLCWVLYGNYSEDALAKGWMMFLYQLPLVNAIFMPLLSIVTASRLCDIEHRGVMLKQLCYITSRGRLYDAKLLYGLGIIMISLSVQFISVFIGGKILGFGGVFPAKLYFPYWLFTIVPTIAVYIVQHSLSLLIKNQAIPFFIGVIGEFCGIFSMFLSQLPLLRKLLIWGWFGALQFVGSDWDRETRIANYYLLDIDWIFFTITVIVTAALYFIGRKLFCESEV